MVDFRGAPVLPGCGGVVIGDTAQQPWLLTAKHCVTNLAGARQILLLRDYVVKGTFAEMLRDAPRSSDYVLMSPFPETRMHPTDDLAVIKLPTAMAGHAVQLPAPNSPRLSKGERVTALSFPLGLPLIVVRDESTVVSDVGNGRFWARIDNFAGSSGSPVFSERGTLEGVIVRLASPGNLDIWHNGNCVVSREYQSGSAGAEARGVEVIDARAAWELLTEQR